MTKWLTKLAENSEVAWIAAIALGCVQAWQWVDQKLYQRYRQRLADASSWNEEQRAKIEQLEQDIQEARSRADDARTEADQANSRADELEEQAREAERHAEWCEQQLLALTSRIREDSDVEWAPEDVTPRELP